MRVDHGGEFWDTVFDVVSLCFSVADVIQNPDDPWAWVGLVADVVSLAVPFATGGGVIVDAVTKADDVVDFARTAGNAEDAIDILHDTQRVTENIGEVAETTVKNLNFDSAENLLDHFTRHNSQFGDMFTSADEYLEGANYVINNGQYVPELNGYIRFLGNGGKANYAFVGLKNAGQNISTFHVKSVRELSKIPSLGFIY